MEDHSDEALQNARKLRREMSLPEVLLWRILRTRPYGVKFRRQHPIGDYVADFYCAQARTVVEVDGMSHDAGDRPQRDQRRDAWLRNKGYTVVRLPAKEVLLDVTQAAEAIARACSDIPPPSAANAAATSPKGGGL
jgi:very-short-patch-repair endonuclease